MKIIEITVKEVVPYLCERYWATLADRSMQLALSLFSRNFLEAPFGEAGCGRWTKEYWCLVYVFERFRAERTGELAGTAQRYFFQSNKIEFSSQLGESSH